LSVPEPSKEVGDVFKCIGDVFTVNLHMEMGKTIGQSIISEHLGVLQFGELFCQPFREKYILEKTHSERTTTTSKTIKFLSNQITARLYRDPIYIHHHRGWA